jgi:hypothetical protein
LTDASQCRGIAENGPDVTLICQHHFSTGCTSHAIANTVTTLILSKKLRLLRIPDVPARRSCVGSNRCVAPSVVLPPFSICLNEQHHGMKVAEGLNAQHHGKNRLQQPHKARCMHANGQTPRDIDVIRRRSQKVTTGRGMSGRVITQK